MSERSEDFNTGYQAAMKACGNCTICYGKGYSTTQVGTKTIVRACKCARGRQMQRIVLKQN